MRVLADVIRSHSTQRGSDVAMFFNGRATSFGTLDQRSNQIANALIKEGVGSESRLAFLDKNSDLFYEVLFGSAKANAVLVPVNWRLAPAEIAYIVNDSLADIVIVGRAFLDVIRNIQSDLMRVKKIIVLEGGDQGFIDYAAWRDNQSDVDPSLEANGSRVVLQMYTSGTTGHPKGVQLTNENMLTLLQSAVNEIGNWTDGDVNLVAMPQFHVGGSNWGLISLYIGARTVIAREFVPADILRLIAEQRITKVFLVPASILFLLQAESIRETDLSSLREVLFGASPMPDDLLREALSVFKCGFAQTYGMTETSGGITYMPPEDRLPSWHLHAGSCGRPFTTVDLRIVDANGSALPPLEVGEIICRTASNMKGYWNLPEETERTIRDGWLYTGDAGYVDADGYLYIHDRVKDMIITGGENVYPAEVESALFSHPAVADVAVIGIPDETWGESILALVVAKPGLSVTADDIIAFARTRIARYKAPKRVEFVDALPRNPSGKILKRKLREQYWAGRARKV